MSNTVIITDTSCDLPEEVVNKLPVIRLKMSVSLKDNPGDDISYLDIKEFYDKMRRGEIIPVTSQVPVNVFMTCFEELRKEGKKGIVLGLSSKLTGSYQAALVAKETTKADHVKVLDTKCASLGTGLVVYKAAQMAEEGRDFDEISREIEFYAHHMEHIFTVDDLEFLKRGGRISGAQAFIGGLLNIKPILHMVDGAIFPLEKVRGRKNVVKRMVEIAAERGKNLENQLIGISHGDNEELALELADAMKREFNVKQIMISWIGPVIGSHSGPGTVALFFQNA
ncbi:DegV family protein [Thermovenabulum gondwanense]|uniref:DegV domain-containing protein n=1 Tax=Thermovenabulum gondwanense TaxID=520767 RepID=A0A161PXB9_9FIRM|nr:DegV family protein [Thermovenabulum gondwanense]KYO66494.1 DegV domain-containing protein [Thermovenabulum gondwanense]